MAKFALLDATGQKKGLLATAAIYSGESIFEESPLICAQYLWNAEYKYLACEFCLAPLESAEENVRRLSGDSSITLPYSDQCCPTNKSHHSSCQCGARFCRAECQGNAWNSYHKVLCPSEPSNAPDLGGAIKKLCDFWKSIHYPPETISIMLLVKILAWIKQSPNPAENISKINQFASCMENSEELVRKLLGEKCSEQMVLIRDMVAHIVYDACLEQFFSEQGFAYLLALISRHGQGIGTSSFSKWAENCERHVANDPAESQRINDLIERLFDKMDSVSGPFLNVEGSGLFTMASCLNHSCVPNAEVRFTQNNNILTVKALDNIEPGKELRICFLDECMQSRSRHSRVKYLQENYGFLCKCPKCEAQANDPDVTSEEDESDDDDRYSDDEEMNCD